MTNLEAVKAAIGANYPFDDNTYLLGLASSVLDPDEVMVSGKSFDLALADLIIFLIASADISEGGYSVKLDRRSLLGLRKALLGKWDMDDGTQPKLRNKTYLW